MKKIIRSIAILIIFINNILAVEIVDGSKYKVIDKGEVTKYFKYNNVEQKIHKYKYILDKDTEKIAYCLDLNLTGPDKVYKKEYDLKVDGLLGSSKDRLTSTKVDEEKIANVISSGYPYVDENTLGVYSEDKAYIATQFAIWTIEEKIEKENLKSMPGQEDVYKAYENILERYKNKKYSSMHTFALEKIDTKYLEENLDKSKVSQRFKLDCNLDMENITYDKIDKIKIVDEELKEVEFLEKEKIYKILIDKKDINDIGEFLLKFNIKYKTDNVYFGLAPHGDYQNMGLCINSNQEYKLEEKIEVEKIKIPISIYKLDSKTKEKLSGAVFQLIDSSNNVISTLETDENGKCDYILDKEGLYTIKEIKAPKGSYIGESKEVEAKLNESVNLEFSNNRYSSIKIIKKDGETKEAIKNVVFKITYENQDVFEKTTNENGEIILDNLKKGSYKIVELKAPTGYTVSKLEHEVNLSVGETKSIEIFNYKAKEEIKNVPLLPKTGY